MKTLSNLPAAFASAVIAPTACVLVFSLLAFQPHEAAFMVVAALVVASAHVLLLGFPAMLLLERLGRTRGLHYGSVGFIIGSLPSMLADVANMAARQAEFAVSTLIGFGVAGVLGAISAVAAWYFGSRTQAYRSVATQPTVQPDGPASGGSAG